MYFCDIQEARGFGELVWATGMQRRATRAKELIFVGDGAKWIWNLVEFYYPHAMQIVGWFHGTEHLALLSLLFGSSAAAHQAWLRQARDDLWNWRLDQVIAACTALAPPGRKDGPAAASDYLFHQQSQPDGLSDLPR